MIYRDGLRHAEAIAIETTNKFWNTEFARHGNKGICTMKVKLGHEIEAAIRAAWEDAAGSDPPEVTP